MTLQNEPQGTLTWLISSSCEDPEGLPLPFPLGKGTLEGSQPFLSASLAVLKDYKRQLDGAANVLNKEMKTEEINNLDIQQCSMDYNLNNITFGGRKT